MDFWRFARSPASVLLMVEFGQARHIEPRKLLQGSDLTVNQLSNPDVMILAGQELKVASNLLSLSGQDAGLGLQVGLSYRLSAYGLLGYGLLSSATGGDALKLVQRFMALTYSYSLIRHRREGKLDVMEFEPSPDLPQELKRFFVERAMGASCRVARDVIGNECQLSAFELSYVETLAADFRVPLRVLGAALHYGQRANVLKFEHELLARPLAQANPITAAMCERMCTDLLSQRRTRLDTAAFIREYLATRSFDRPPQLGDMAKLLNTSERTLKRRLQADGVNFRELSNQVRRAKAESLVAQGSLSLAEIADALGFSDLSSFSQAYKRWTGVSPSVARRESMAV